MTRSNSFFHHKGIIGIDPGQKGGIAIIPNIEDLLDARAYRYPGDVVHTASLFKELIELFNIRLVVLESVHAMPGQGVSSTFKFGKNVGEWRGIIAASGIPFIEPSPQRWQKAVWDNTARKNKTTKELSLEIARKLWPDIDLRYKADDGKADALHLAHYGVRYLRGETK